MSPKQRQADDPSNPSLIIICSWVGAVERHVKYYTEAYQRIFPGSAQLVISIDPMWYTKTAQARQDSARLPAQRIRDALARSDQSPPRVLVHVFSIGGAWTLAEVSMSLTRMPRSYPAPSAIVFDSSPGDITLASANGGYASPIQNSLQRSMAMLFISSLYLYAVGSRMIAREPDPWSSALATLNTPDFLPWTSTTTPRLYVYSTNDKISSAACIDAHAEGARAEGIRVHMIQFEESGHVAHARTDPERYWEAVEDLWEEAVDIASSPRTLAKL